MPGDVVELRENHLIINGVPLDYDSLDSSVLKDVSESDRESHIFATEKLATKDHAVAGYPSVPAMRNFAPVTIPEGHYFMMGDNRDDSFDSRYFGPVKRSLILGRATAVVMSFDKQHHWSPRWNRFFSKLDGTSTNAP